MTDVTESPYRVNLDSPSTGPAGKYLVWFSASDREIDIADSLQEALEEARIRNDSEYSLFDFIEGPAGRVPDTDVQRWLNKRDRESTDAWRARREAEKQRPIFCVMVLSSDGKTEGKYDTLRHEAKALESARDVNLPGRVKIYSYMEGQHFWWQPQNQRVILDYGQEVPA